MNDNDKDLPDFGVPEINYRAVLKAAIEQAYEEGRKDGWSRRPRMSGPQLASWLLLTLFGTTLICGVIVWIFLELAVRGCK